METYSDNRGEKIRWSVKRIRVLCVSLFRGANFKALIREKKQLFSRGEGGKKILFDEGTKGLEVEKWGFRV